MTAAPRIDALPADLDDADPAELTRNAELETVRFAGLSVDELDLRSARLREVELDQVNLPVVRAARGQWRDVRVSGRLGSVEAYDAQWRSVHFVGCKLSFVNLRGAELLDVAFTGCVVEELDLLDARARRVRLEDTRVGHLSLREGELRDVDLRGAELESIDGVRHLRGVTVSSGQLTLMAPLLAEALGILVED
ncbi:pentapeptide repeat-containing protein [Nocardioides sp. LMS-CY]|uniref:Uncharacterized protein YjbI with pentapeptide repeats n=1 Tax=Nocardioides soli TaxID=1036020 RepID=A0A7W4VX33_9ACTN|nr:MULTISPECIES: pentapeptide repeat-containing protein [Nocardioides]MBB3042897.1 uncharacterized protein YjbI with pentapeptide repeats [Nocardioides soli]QWF23001.1 pentapeptide repeat-containing protein [Nocardioides sp. LMS-CY]